MRITLTSLSSDSHHPWHRMATCLSGNSAGTSSPDSFQVSSWICGCSVGNSTLAQVALRIRAGPCNCRTAASFFISLRKLYRINLPPRPLLPYNSAHLTAHLIASPPSTAVHHPTQSREHTPTHPSSPAPNPAIHAQSISVPYLDRHVLEDRQLEACNA